MSYRGYHNLRSAKEEITLEPWQEEELKKCADDPEYFIRNYCYINTDTTLILAHIGFPL